MLELASPIALTTKWAGPPYSGISNLL
ncbi:protein of unknown function (plasmid) [Cupriavidus taiwanensis]|uniref:Uncharacterized protein n=1 Tax=Cupriavidus taiwanensis TaxID=164546 RepID=A0A7Z7JEP9_9BURK|nr:protein of unknown function [Cupriavidus taiwanensis]SOZ11651.1 protein of unknown function [Cupriavidus taiwanensis]SOZ43006.1 protein of unknown function [Cupriavidus taiwanensis]SPC22253.1 protein of unknown function [Cupriavidus taiwanensis]SPD53755.1 protein of unknown function [Cupriavidus taiwanensis]